MSDVAFFDTEAAAGLITHDCDLADRMNARGEKLDEQAREIVASIARKYYDQRKLDGRQDERSEEGLAREDWLRAEAAFCEALERRIQREIKSGRNQS
jgi:ATPase subunit of ABC transporter with duplicated ATPase domains